MAWVSRKTVQEIGGKTEDLIHAGFRGIAGKTVAKNDQLIPGNRPAQCATVHKVEIGQGVDTSRRKVDLFIGNDETANRFRFPGSYDEQVLTRSPEQRLLAFCALTAIKRIIPCPARQLILPDTAIRDFTATVACNGIVSRTARYRVNT